MSYPPMCGWADGSECDDCTAKNKRCYCYRVANLPIGGPVDQPAQLPEGE